MAVALDDGRIVPADSLRVFWDAPGLRQGYGLFETIRVASGRAFLAGCHAQRITQGALRLELDPWLHPRTLTKAIDRLAREAGVEQGAIRVYLLPGGPVSGEEPGDLPENASSDGPRAVTTQGQGRAVGGASGESGGGHAGHGGGWSSRHHRPRYLGTIAALRIEAPASVQAVLAPDLRDPRGPLVGLKTISYAGERLLLARARREGAGEALRRNLAGRISEGTRSNVFVIEGRRLVTPPLSEGLLPGVTRWFLLRIAGESGFEPAEEAVPVERLLAAQEAFLTSTLRGIVPLIALDGRPIAGGNPGPGSLRLRAILERHVARRT